MKSPITGLEMSLKNEPRSLTFRKEEFQIYSFFYLCTQSKEEFTTDELDEINILQVHNQYRDKYNLPFPKDIKTTRKKYNLSAARISEILGFGINSYRNYENGEMPSLSNGRIIQLTDDPKNFLSIVKMSEAFKGDQKEKLITKINEIILAKERNATNDTVANYLMKNSLPGVFTGYVKPNLDKLTEMVVYFAEHVSPFKTKLNKLLFYADFLAFRDSCFSMSGVKYKAIQMGPIPNNYNSIFEYISNANHVNVEITDFGDDKIGERFVANPNRKFNAESFTDLELSTLANVAAKFKDTSTSSLIDISHQEKGWIDNHENKSFISYNYAFEISN